MITVNKDQEKNQTKNGKLKRRVLVLRGEQNIIERKQSKSFIKNKTNYKRTSPTNLLYNLKHLYLFFLTSIKFFLIMKSLQVFLAFQSEVNLFRNLKCLF